MSSTTDAVRNWLSKTGFPLEMQAASAFLQAGFHVSQSHAYEDETLAKVREVDVLATDPDYAGIVDIMFLLECKASSKPWIVFLPSEGLIKYNRLHTLALTSKAALNELAEKVKNPLPAYIENSDPRGYSLRQAFGTDDDPAYTAAFGLLKSCAALTRENGIPSMPRHAFAFPVFVVDSPLFECRYKQGEDIELTEVQVSSFLFQNRVPEHRGCRVTVVTRPHLDTFAAYAKELANEIRADFKAVQKRYISGGA